MWCRGQTTGFEHRLLIFWRSSESAIPQIGHFGVRIILSRRQLWVNRCSKSSLSPLICLKAGHESAFVKMCPPYQRKKSNFHHWRQGLDAEMPLHTQAFLKITLRVHYSPMYVLVTSPWFITHQSPNPVFFVKMVYISPWVKFSFEFHSLLRTLMHVNVINCMPFLLSICLLFSSQALSVWT